MNNWYIKYDCNNHMDIIECNNIEDFHNAINCNTFNIVSSPYPCPSDFYCNILMIIDDDGKILDKPINHFGTAIYNSSLDFIVGDILLGRLNQIGDDIEGFSDFDSAYNFGVFTSRIYGIDLVD